MAAGVLIMRAAVRFGLLVLPPLLFQAIATADVLVVANARQPLNHLTLRQVKDLYLGRQPELDSAIAIKVFDQRNGQPTRQLFYAQLLGKSEAQIDAYWARLEFAGHVSPLQQLADDQSVLKQLQKDPNAIGYVQSTTLPEGFKSLLVLTTPP